MNEELQIAQHNSLSTQKYPMTSATMEWFGKLLSERFGHSWCLELRPDRVELRLVGAEGCIIFDRLLECFSVASSTMPCTQWQASSEGFNSVFDELIPMPGLGAPPSKLVEKVNGNHVVHYDILGLTYWMLTRVEEIGRRDLDEHGRFPAVNSHAFRNGYLRRPIVDEWLHLLSQVTVRQWPSISLPQRKPRLLVSCDVDHPFAVSRSPRQVLKRVVGDLVKRKSLKAAVKTLTASLDFSENADKKDPYIRNINWMMDVNEQAGNTIAFFFLAGGSHVLDGRYTLSEPRIEKLLTSIADRGHEVGFHGSYTSFDNPIVFGSEARSFLRTLEKVGIAAQQIGGRQHYLRWKTPQTHSLWDQNGFNYDSTLGYADRLGFRCGTCIEYTAFNPVNQSRTRLRERPLVVMECTAISNTYEDLGYSEQCIEAMLQLKRTCFAIGGDFTLLWHNSSFDSSKEMAFYSALIR